MTKENLDNKLAGQSSTPYMSLKTPLYNEHIVTVDEHKLLHNQIKRVTEILNRTNAKRVMSKEKWDNKLAGQAPHNTCSLKNPLQ